MPTTASRPPALASRRASVLRGAFWGVVSGVLVSLIVSALMQRSLAPETSLGMLWEAVQQAGGSAVWGAVWGTMWGIGRRPVASGRASRPGRILTGAVLGAMVGMLTSTLLGGTPGSTSAMPQGPVPAWLRTAAWDAPLTLMREIGRALVAGIQLHALPGASVGSILGMVWGACGR